VAVFPGTLESVFGLSYDFRDEWGVSRGTYEALTLGTLAVVFAIAVIGYALGRSVRERVAVIPLEADVPAPAALT
jgi:hypothetical protein